MTLYINAAPAALRLMQMQRVGYMYVFWSILVLVLYDFDSWLLSTYMNGFTDYFIDCTFHYMDVLHVHPLL